MPKRGKIDRSQPLILGLAASHNGSACLLNGSNILVAIQEERISRIKRARTYGAAPLRCIRYCLDAFQLKPDDLDLIVLCCQDSATNPLNDVSRNPQLRIRANDTPFYSISHHLGHAVGAYATSGYPEAAILVIDGAGSPLSDLGPDEVATVVGKEVAGRESASIYKASGGQVTPIEKHLTGEDNWVFASGGSMKSYRSVGGLYAAVSHQIFGSLAEAGKVMGLAPYGHPAIPTGQFFSIERDGLIKFSDTLSSKVSLSERWPNNKAFYQDLACSAQKAVEQAVLSLAKRAKEITSSDTLCMAGGVALNAIANERVIRETGFSKVFIMPAADDGGTAIGAAYHGLGKITSRVPTVSGYDDALGISYTRDEIELAIRKSHLPATATSSPASAACSLLRDGKKIGWFIGRSEFGPRALGQRSMLANPSDLQVRNDLNLRVKGREGFRPFAPAALLQDVPTFFDVSGVAPESPYMTRILQLTPDAIRLVPAVAHVDGSARLQSVRLSNHPFALLIAEFKRETGIPMVLNTSFNGAGEPIVESPIDALRCMCNTGLDACVFDEWIVYRK